MREQNCKKCGAPDHLLLLLIGNSKRRRVLVNALRRDCMIGFGYCVKPLAPRPHVHGKSFVMKFNCFIIQVFL
jgi:hypothetical protein